MRDQISVGHRNANSAVVNRRSFVATCAGIGLAITENKTRGQILAAETTPFQRTQSNWEKCGPGPWGPMEYEWFSLRYREDDVERIVQALPAPNQFDRWHFTGMSSDQVKKLLETIDASKDALDALMDTSTWRISDVSVVVDASPGLVLNLKPNDRRRIYNRLANTKENPAQFTPFVVTSSRFDQWLKLQKLTPQTNTLLRRLCYEVDGKTVFADAATVMRSVPDKAEQRRFIAAMLSNPAGSARLVINESSDLRQIAEYWGRYKSVDETFDLLFSMKTAYDAYVVDIASFLPSFAHQRLNRYSVGQLSDGTESPADCFWTAVNFANDPPVPSPFKDGFVQYFHDHYQLIGSRPRFGDLVGWFSDDNKFIHAANYVADDVVFTKNGHGTQRPWLLQTMDDVSAIYGQSIRFLRANA